MPAPDALTPGDRYLELFTAVQAARVFPDSKTFVDCAPRGEPDAILAAYRAAVGQPGFDLPAFVDAHFEVLRPTPSDYVSVPGQPMCAHIDDLWRVLTREPLDHRPRGSLLPVPHPYVVPGGRFGELYYWDSYFTMLGLAASGKTTLLHDMVGNFAHLIDTFGHVPNGTRTYYLSRSQPPLFAFMVELAGTLGVLDPVQSLPQLRREHAWWMRGSEDLAPGTADLRVVRLPDGSLLNRYWDERDSPREEAWLEDVQTARASGRDASQVYRHLRAAAESGWDFSTRWLAEPVPRDATSLASICTTDIVPVDLNAFLYKLETLVASLSTRAGDATTACAFGAAAAARKAAVIAHLWDAGQGAFFDHDWRLAKRRAGLTGACVAPLFAGLAEASHARALAQTVSARLLAPGGFSTTERTSDQQWDQPNGWAALQWMAIRGFHDHGEEALARTIAHRWLATVAAVYEREGKLVEKYALRQDDEASSSGGGGGEYPLQDGFGWTNGVTRALLAAHPEHTAHGCFAYSVAPTHR
ncbi:alpha,alpha-trehalase TreF [Variovorax sp. PAMC 28711]|uniref:alpha,alpha-trehalase TreF n=1 Tax=Variovorax sp. PAMC 28711 TaxID=1795631 RepID=UPI000A8F11F1|nr:alpha,alpha-trehalase TreF [Variovorax sp. PAMC 28711]